MIMRVTRLKQQAEELAVEGLMDGLAADLEPAGSDGDVGAVTDGFEEALSLGMGEERSASVNMTILPPLREYPDGKHLTFNHRLTFIMLPDRRVSSMPIKIKLCPPCPDPDCPPTECPDVEITPEHVTIGENQNTVTLTYAQWNELVARVRSGELPPV